MTPLQTELRRLEERERSKRFLAWGAILALYAASWLLFGYRASRIDETDCTVVRLSNGYCTLGHVEGGHDYTLPWDDCDKPTRWPNPDRAPARIGQILHCYYYRSWPDDIFFERREHHWLTPIPIAVLLLGTGLGLEGARRRRKSAPASTPAPVADAYREARVPEPDPRAALELPLASGHWSRWLLGGPFLVLGLALTALGTWLGWNTGGEFGAGALLTMAVSHGSTVAGAFAIFHRSGLGFDPSRGLIFRWWGLGGRWFFRYALLEKITAVDAEHHAGARSSSDYLVIQFGDGRPWKFLRARSLAEDGAARIRKYLAEGREGN